MSNHNLELGEEAQEYKEVIDRRQLFKILKHHKNLREISNLLHLNIESAYINLHYLVKEGVIKTITPTDTLEIFYALPEEARKPKG